MTDIVQWGRGGGVNAMRCPCFPFERGQNFSFDWPASVSNILTVRKWAEPNIVGRNFTSRIRPGPNESVRIGDRRGSVFAKITNNRTSNRYTRSICRTNGSVYLRNILKAKKHTRGTLKIDRLWLCKFSTTKDQNRTHRKRVVF